MCAVAFFLYLVFHPHSVRAFFATIWIFVGYASTLYGLFRPSDLLISSLMNTRNHEKLNCFMIKHLLSHGIKI